MKGWKVVCRQGSVGERHAHVIDLDVGSILDGVDVCLFWDTPYPLWRRVRRPVKPGAGPVISAIGLSDDFQIFTGYEIFEAGG